MEPEFEALQTAVAGRYSLEREIGRGGMGIVFLARDVALERPVAIKLLPPEMTRKDEVRLRFLREARTAAGLAHPNIVPIHLVEERDDLVFFVMAYVEGESLGQRIRRSGALPPSEVARIMREVAWALGHAHQRGVVHRDIKPDNILLERGSGRAVVTDFGIAQVAEAGTLTGGGELLGTVRYMSPEQIAGDEVDGRSDLYALGVTAFHALAGRPPFEAPNIPALVYRIVHEPAPPVAGAAEGVPPRLAEVVDRCLARDPSHRPPTAEAVAEALEAVTPGARALPAELRALLRGVHDWGVGTAAVAGVLFVVGSALDFATLRSLPGWTWVYGAAFAAGAGSDLLRRARAALRAGYGHGDLRNALLAEARAREEELTLDPRWRARVERARLGWGWGPLQRIAAMAAGAVFGVGGLVEGDVLLAALAAGLVVFVALAPVLRARWSRNPFRSLRWFERLVAGSVGGLMLRLASPRRDGALPPAPALDRPTEALVGAAAEDLWAALPRETRRRLADVPGVVRDLQADVSALRRRERALSEALVGAGTEGAVGARTDGASGGAHAEVWRARQRVRERLTRAVSALEHIRLALVRLNAGAAGEEDLTLHLEAARQAHREVEAEAEGREEVRRLLEGDAAG